MQFHKKKFFANSEVKSFVTDGFAQIDARPTDHTIYVTIDGFYMGVRSLRQAAVLFLQMADELEERNDKEKDAA